MSEPAPNRDVVFEALRQSIRDRIARGDLDAAQELAVEALDHARHVDDPDLVDLAYSNYAGILIARGQGEGTLPELRRVLMRSRKPEAGFVAATNISRHHEIQRDTAKSLFYARRALEKAEATGNAAHVAFAHNQLANILVLDSRFAEACEHYLGAVEMPERRPVDRAVILANLGYCESVLGHFERAFPRLFESLRILRREGAGTWERLPRLGLAYAYLEAGRYRRARRHGLQALSLAEATPGAEEQVKNALYLLGETEKLDGRDFAAFSYFSRLQRTFYPGESFVVEVLMTTDIRGLINLMA